MEIQELKNRIKELEKENTELENELSKLQCDYRQLYKENDTLKTTINKQSKDISEQLQELDKKDKVIDLMAEYLCGIDVMNELGRDSWNWNKEQMKEYFYKKVEEENN